MTYPWRAELLQRPVPTDPNETAIAEFAHWMSEHRIGFHFTPNDNHKPSLNMWINTTDADGPYHTLKFEWNKLMVVHEDFRPEWTRYVYMDARSEKFIFQRKLCIYCDRSWAEHEEGKCLFSSTTFAVKKGAT